jgi:hypothetical protein
MNESPTTLCHIAPIFHVSNLSRSLTFYRDQLGFGVEFVFDDLYVGGPGRLSHPSQGFDTCLYGIGF